LLSLAAWKKGHQPYLILGILLVLTAATEISAQYMLKRRIDFTALYHAFVLIEYPFFAGFLLSAVKPGKFSTVVKISIPVYILISLSVSLFYYHFRGFPGLNINIEGMLESILCTYILFNLEAQEGRSILRNQYFWICSGILTFFGTTFFFNSVYTNVLHMDGNKARELFGIINGPLNLILYAFIIIGILCLPTSRKFITQ
jgi:hypothetical protein